MRAADGINYKRLVRGATPAAVVWPLPRQSEISTDMQRWDVGSAATPHFIAGGIAGVSAATRCLVCGSKLKEPSRRKPSREQRPAG